MDEDKRTIWMRVGMSYTGTKEEIEAILGGDETPDFKRALRDGTAEIDGETYIPSFVIEDYNAVEGTDFETAEINYYL